MKFDMKKEIDSIIKSRHEVLSDAYRKKQQLEAIEVPLRALLRLCEKNGKVYYWGSNLSVHINVTNMRDIADYLESFEDITGCEFTSTRDDTEYSKSRTFKMGDFPLEVVADVSENDESAACRAVQVGEKVVPVWELRCDE